VINYIEKRDHLDGERDNVRYFSHI
jgi:hypothetical protein